MMIEPFDQFVISTFPAQAAVDFNSRGFEEGHETIEARPYIGALQSVQRSAEEILRHGVYFGTGPCREAGRLAAFAEVSAALVFLSDEPLGVGERLVAVSGGGADGHASAAQHGPGASAIARRWSIGEFQFDRQSFPRIVGITETVWAVDRLVRRNHKVVNLNRVPIKRAWMSKGNEFMQPF